MYPCYITRSGLKMATNMHRLQISLPQAQLRFLRDRARRDGVSAAEVIRQLLEREAKEQPITQADIDQALSFVGIGADEGPLIDGLPVSANVDLYMAEAIIPSRVLKDRNVKLKKARRATRRKI
jgi:hypothetical protein